MSAPVQYAYVGPPEIRVAATPGHGVLVVQDGHELKQWLGMHAGQSVFTYVIDLAGTLLLAPRHSEHVACAEGADVLAAGEITFGTNCSVTAVSNQSTGYCPEPTSWPCVAAALDQLSIAHPDGFTDAIEFRRCPQCSQINIVRDHFFVCAVCDADLPLTWNIAALQGVVAQYRSREDEDGRDVPRWNAVSPGHDGQVSRRNVQHIRNVLNQEWMRVMVASLKCADSRFRPEAPPRHVSA